MLKKLLIYCSTVPQDAEFLTLVGTHLHALSRGGRIEIWHRGLHKKGEDADQEAGQKFTAADLIICLLSSFSLASDTCSAEASEALLRYERGASAALFVLLRPVVLRGTTLVSAPLLPRNRMPVSEWPDWHLPLTEIAAAVTDLVEKHAQPALVPPVPSLPASGLSSEQILSLQRSLSRIFSIPSSIRAQASSVGIHNLADEPPDTMWYQVLRQLVNSGGDLAPLLRSALEHDPRDAFLHKLVQGQ